MAALQQGRLQHYHSWVVHTQSVCGVVMVTDLAATQQAADARCLQGLSLPVAGREPPATRRAACSRCPGYARLLLFPRWAHLQHATRALLTALQAVQGC